MMRGINQQQIFEDSYDYEKFLYILLDCKAISEFEIYAYCLMGNHIHLLIKEGKEPLERLMKRITVRFVMWYNLKYERTGHLFQDRFKSEPVNDYEYFAAVVRYIHQNPIKAGLCKELKQYKYSSYNSFFKNNGLVDTDFVFEIINKDEFEAFNNEITDEKLLDIQEKSRVLVTDEYAQMVIQKYSGCSSVAEFQKIPVAQRDKYIQQFRKNGLSIRQISRLTGVSHGIVRKF